MNNSNSRPLPTQNPANPRSGAAFYLWELWAHVPVWFNLYTIVMVAMLAIVYFSPVRRLSTLTALLPLIWFFLYWYARLSVDKTVSTKKPLIIMVISVAVYLIAINVVLKPVWDEDVLVPVTKYYPQASVGDVGKIVDQNGEVIFHTGDIITAPNGRQYKVEGPNLVFLQNKNKIVTGFEISNIFWAIVLIVHCLYFRGRAGFIKFFLAAGLYGFFLESGGVMMDFFRENDYHLYLPLLAAPVATMAGWSTVFYPSVFTFEKLSTRWPRLQRINVLVAGLIISLIALLWDAHLDPVATGLGLWTWHEFLPPWFLGVPLVNFTSWLSAVFTFGVGYVWIHRHEDWSQKKKIAAMFVMIPVVQLAAALINFPLAGIAEGFDGPVWQVVFVYINNFQQNLAAIF